MSYVVKGKLYAERKGLAVSDCLLRHNEKEGEKKKKKKSPEGNEHSHATSRWWFNHSTIFDLTLFLSLLGLMAKCCKMMMMQK